ncbi:MAG: universal stress protein [Flavobacteriales bacterium]
MQRILIPTDFSEMAQNAVNYGVELARRAGARITIMHSVQKPLVPPQGPVRDLSDIPQEDDASIALWQELEGITNWIREGRPEIEKVSQRMPSGLPGDEILKNVEEEQVDLVVMGTKGEKGFGDTLMGTTAANVLQKASCDVLLIPEEARFNKYEQVAYATGLNEKDPRALKKLFRFLEDDPKARVDAVHVLGKGEGLNEKHYEAFEKGLEKEGLSEKVTFEKLEGDHLEEVLDWFIQHKGVDLLAMLNESRNFFQRLFHNSKSKKMAFHTKVPLLVIHAESELRD